MHADSQSFKIYINPLKFPRQFFAAPCFPINIACLPELNRPLTNALQFFSLDSSFRLALLAFRGENSKKFKFCKERISVTVNLNLRAVGCENL